LCSIDPVEVVCPQFPVGLFGFEYMVEDLSELAPKIHATAMDRGFGSFVTTMFCVKEEKWGEF
jgi:hypothetical protein